ncbi:hypothetical protein [Roseinatronobacter alkalisoli]|uniref:Uncharacterized protein n=1 Tax=Roseinatronobacter alkalisoli TaxID=3028235 RepID=A0ABT5TGZ6_9RHOB|nr:hypothetical protein [Roseinatronobacter sp. HJB301]MDD7973636.1 hypothetical protein [Roseinatronobacter sp. HJB301]
MQIDLATLELERAVRQEDHAAVLQQIDRMRDLSASAGEGEILFFEAEAALALIDFDRAEAALIRFAATVGRGSELYPAALELILDIPRLRDEQAARVAAEAEAERRRQAALEREQARLAAARAAQRRDAVLAARRAEERRVLASRETVRTVRFILHGRYSGNLYALPPVTTLQEPLTNQERDWVSRLLGQREQRYIDAAALQRILSPPFRPARYGVPTGAGVEVHGDWVSSRISNGHCRIETQARSFPEGSQYVHPRMFFDLGPSIADGSLVFALLTPVQFRGDRPISVRVDDTSFPAVLHDNGNVTPAQGSDWSAVTRSIRAGQQIEISGTDRYTDSAVRIGFSAIGFTRAFLHMAAACNRSDQTARYLGDGSAPAIGTTTLPRTGALREGPPTLLPDTCLLVVAARRSMEEVNSYIRGMQARDRQNARAFGSPNGWIAIAIGTLTRSTALDEVARMVRSGRVPDDAYCTLGAHFLREFSVPR